MPTLRPYIEAEVSAPKSLYFLKFGWAKKLVSALLKVSVGTSILSFHVPTLIFKDIICDKSRKNKTNVVSDNTRKSQHGRL